MMQLDMRHLCGEEGEIERDREREKEEASFCPDHLATQATVGVNRKGLQKRCEYRMSPETESHRRAC